MKKKLLLLLLVGMAARVSAGEPRGLDTIRFAKMEQWRQSPHALQLRCGTLMYHKEAYKIFTKMPALNFSLTYTYDISWQHRRTNFFVLGGLAYEGCRRDDEPYRAKNRVVYEDYVYNQYHLDFGAGLRVRLAPCLDLDFSVAFDGSMSFEYVRYPSFYGKEVLPEGRDGSIYMGRQDFGLYVRGLFAMNLTYEIKRIRISIGCQVYVGDLMSMDNLALYDEDLALEWGKLNWRNGQPKNSWVTLGIGYRFGDAKGRKEK